MEISIQEHKYFLKSYKWPKFSIYLKLHEDTLQPAGNSLFSLPFLN